MSEDWSSYNNALVSEVSYFFTRNMLDALKVFDVESKGKVGRPPYPNSLISTDQSILQASIQADRKTDKGAVWQAKNKYA